MQASRIQSEMQQLGAISLLSSSARKGDPYKRGGGEEATRAAASADGQEGGAGQPTPEIRPDSAEHHKLPNGADSSEDGRSGERDRAQRYEQQKASLPEVVEGSEEELKRALAVIEASCGK